MPAGRPTGYDADYCDDAEAFLREGYSLAALAGQLGVARSTIYEWIEHHPEFSDAVKRGQAGAVLWWEKANRTLATTGEGNATACVFGLKNRAADEWRDKTETEHSGQVTVNKVVREFHDAPHPDR
jgi:transposase-like protein